MILKSWIVKNITQYLQFQRVTEHDFLVHSNGVKVTAPGAVKVVAEYGLWTRG
jgi:hypothetical protein